jgi:RNase P subunit RPR2
MKAPTHTNHHRHSSVTLRAIRQRSGIPYEIERKVCPECKRVLDEKPLRRAAA